MLVEGGKVTTNRSLSDLAPNWIKETLNHLKILDMCNETMHISPDSLEVLSKLSRTKKGVIK